MLADDISKFWVELLSQTDDSGKREMFQWFMEQLRKAEKGECKAFCREHWQNTAARMYYIGLCEEEGTYEEALQALDESIAKDRSLSQLQIRDYEKQKKDIYRVIKDEEHYREQLWKLVEDYSPVDIELYRELRGLYDEKSWSELRERIISSIRDFQSRNELLKEEKLYDRLLDSVLLTAPRLAMQCRSACWQC